MNRYKRTTAWGIMAVIVFYAALMAMAVMNECTRQAPVNEEVQDDSTVSSHFEGQDIHEVIDWASELVDTIKRPAGKLPQRYIPKGIGGLDNGKEPVDEALLLRTDVFAEFMKRFNADSTELQRLGSIDFTDKGSWTPRIGCILSLVNEVDVTTNPVIRQFAQDIHDNNVYMDDEFMFNIAAVATIAYRDTLGQTFPVRLIFRGDDVDGAPVWYLFDAESPYFTCGKPDKPYYIPQTDAEMQFMGLTRNTDRSAQSMAGPDFKPDGRTAFLMLTSKGFIRYEWHSETCFVAWVGDYTILIEHVESYVHKRSGFLITRIVKDGELIFENRP